MKTARTVVSCRAAMDAESGILVFIIGLEIIVPEGFGDGIVSCLAKMSRVQELRNGCRTASARVGPPKV